MWREASPAPEEPDQYIYSTVTKLAGARATQVHDERHNALCIYHRGGSLALAGELVVCSGLATCRIAKRRACDVAVFYHFFHMLPLTPMIVFITYNAYNVVHADLPGST